MNRITQENLEAVLLEFDQIIFVEYPLDGEPADSFEPEADIQTMAYVPIIVTEDDISLAAHIISDYPRTVVRSAAVEELLNGRWWWKLRP